MPKKTAIATNRRHPQETTSYGSVRLHGLQSIKQNVRSSGIGVAKDTYDEYRRSNGSHSMQPIQLIHAAVTLPFFKWHQLLYETTIKDTKTWDWG